MAGLKSSSTDLSCFHFSDTKAVTAAKLKQFAFRSIDDAKTEELAFGWVNIDDPMDTAWQVSPPDKGEWLCWAFRMDKRSVPAQVVKKHLAEALKDELAKYSAQGIDGVPRTRKKELKEAIRLKLLAKAEPVSSTVDVALNLARSHFIIPEKVIKIV